MGRRCGCVSDECSCAIVAGRGISFSGTGDANNPLIVSTTYEAHAYMQGRSSSNTDVNLTGSGTGDDPYTLSVDFNVPDPRPLPTSTYTSAGTFTWVRPSNTTMVDVWVIGAGASGTPGNSAAYEGGYTGGQGGAGGAYSYSRIVLPSEVVAAQVRVGMGGSSVSYYSGSYSNRGGDSWVKFSTDNPATVFTDLAVTAAGGYTPDYESAAGTYPGQYARDWYSEVPFLTVPSGGAGGGGGGGVGDTRYGRDGGYHYWFAPTQRMAGSGGAGGDARGLFGAGINYNGLDGGRGAGGGGGGAPSASEYGGDSGAGGNGAVWIVSI